MNIYIELNNIVEYIENHLEEKIDYKEISKMIGVNEYTFQKIFSVICNISITEYIRNRRLSNAGQELYLKNEKVIDMAIRYQYENATSFSRAFEKFHGIKPSEVRKKPYKLKIYTKLHFDEIKERDRNIEYKIIESKYKNRNNVEMVFTRKNGSYAGTDVIKYPFKIIHHELQIENCRFYDLRGSYATKCLRNGVEIKDVADILGHKRIETTQNYYIFSTENTKKQVNAILEEMVDSNIIN